MTLTQILIVTASIVCIILGRLFFSGSKIEPIAEDIIETVVKYETNIDPESIVDEIDPKK